jgi:sialic acid synthase
MKRTTIIAEIGQNHNGDMGLARTLIEMCAMPIIDRYDGVPLPGVDAIKLTKRDLTQEMTYAASKAAYTGPNSFGRTYGGHRAALELSVADHAELAGHARARGLEVVETICAPTMVRPIVDEVRPRYLKVASRDLTNGPLLEAMAVGGVPVILSTGMHGLAELDQALEILGERVAVVMHCLSQYPADYAALNLETIRLLRDRYLYRATIGYSDHSPGIVMPAVAVALGATFIEKHVTISHRLPGSDHAGSLEANGLYRMVRDIRNTERALGSYKMEAHESAQVARNKLERSISTGPSGIKAGEIISAANTLLLSPGTGVTWPNRAAVYGQRAKVDIPPMQTVCRSQLENVH